MRKKELLNQNIMLFDKLKKSEISVIELERENQDLKRQIEQLKQQLLASKYNRDNSPEAETTDVVPTVTEAAYSYVNDEIDYGSEIIGRIVISATMAGNRITKMASSVNTKELINLILGRTEVAKAEILNIVNLNYDFAKKKDLIDSQYEQALEYFDSILAQ